MANKDNKFAMDKHNSSLLPYVLDLISRRRNLSITVDELCEEIKDAVLYDHISSFGTVRNAINFALEVGLNLGIISLIDERVRVPFNFRMNNNNSKSNDNFQRFKPKELDNFNGNPAKALRTANTTRKNLPTTARRAQPVRRRLERQVRMRPATTRYVSGGGYKRHNTAGRRRPTVKANHQRRATNNSKNQRRHNGANSARRRH